MADPDEPGRDQAGEPPADPPPPDGEPPAPEPPPPEADASDPPDALRHATEGRPWTTGDDASGSSQVDESPIDAGLRRAAQRQQEAEERRAAIESLNDPSPDDGADQANWHNWGSDQDGAGETEVSEGAPSGDEPSLSQLVRELQDPNRPPQPGDPTVHDAPGPVRGREFPTEPGDWPEGQPNPFDDAGPEALERQPVQGRELTPEAIRQALDRVEQEDAAPDGEPPTTPPPAATPQPGAPPQPATPPPVAPRQPRRVGFLDRLRERALLVGAFAVAPVLVAGAVYVIATGGSDDAPLAPAATATPTAGLGAAAVLEGTPAGGQANPTQTPDAVSAAPGVLPPGRYNVTFNGTRAPGCSGGNPSFTKPITIEVEGLLRDDGTRTIGFVDGLRTSYGTIVNDTGAIEMDDGYIGVLDETFSNPIQWIVEVPGCTATYDIEIEPR